ncbi:MAG: hemerythrin domain-containing protein, partial [Polyangiaceae bacterium]
MSNPSNVTESIEELLSAEHRSFDELGRRLIAAIAHDEEASRAIWHELRAVLAVHVEGEDRFLIPALARRQAQEARALLAEHRLIRERVKEIDAALATGLPDLQAVQGFIDELNAHARHEKKVLYAHCDA